MEACGSFNTYVNLDRLLFFAFALIEADYQIADKVLHEEVLP
jgi:hypothetical protein